jgi:hypothetical protein
MAGKPYKKSGGAGKKKTPPPVPALDPQQIFLQAICFHYSGIMLGIAANARLELYQQAQAPADPASPKAAPSMYFPAPGGEFVGRIAMQTPPYAIAPTWVSSIVIAAFTMELYLKCILVLDSPTSKPWGHELLDKLYNKLKPERRRRLEELFEEEVKNDHPFATMRSVVPGFKSTLLDVLTYIPHNSLGVFP